MRATTTVALFVIIFGLVIGTLGETGAFDVKLAAVDMSLDENDIQEITDGIDDGGINEFTQIATMFSIAKVMILGVVSALTIIPLGVAYNLPLEWLAVFQAAIWFVYVSDRLGWISGRDF